MMKIQFISLWLFILIIDSCTPQKSEPEVSGLRCEYLANPVGLDLLNPRLSWQMKKDVRGARQSAYRIMAATSDELLLNDSPDLWDSGKIESDQSIHVVYNGKPLQSGMKVSWKVQIWDEENNVSSWSIIANWEMGLLNEGDWQQRRGKISIRSISILRTQITLLEGRGQISSRLASGLQRIKTLMLSLTIC